MPLRSMKMFARKRASPGISYAKSVSRRSANSALFFSGVIGSSSRFTVAGSSAGAAASSGCMWPSFRTSGVVPTDKCRSDAFASHIR